MNKDTSSQEYLDLKAELRSLLISSQQGCDEQQLLRDYNQYNGRRIPYSDMGYSSLLELLISMPDVARIDQFRGTTTIHGVADQNTAHIKKLVMAQKRKKNTRSTRGGPNRSNMNNRTNVSSTFSRNRQGSYNGASNGIPSQSYNQNKPIPRPYLNTFNSQSQSVPQQYTTIPYVSSSVTTDSVRNQKFPTPKENSESLSKMSTNRMVASFPPKTSLTPSPTSVLPLAAGSIRETPTMDDTLSVMDEDLIYSEDDELAVYDQQRAEEYGENIIFLRKRIRQKTFHEELNLEKFQLKNLMAFFDCVSDFVNSERDRLPASTDRIFFLKPKFTEAIKRELQLAEQMKSPATLSNVDDNQNLATYQTNGIPRPLVDRSSFVSLDFQYEQLKYESNEPFIGFLGSVENPWIIHIGNIQFLPKRDHMMIQLQDHYNHMSNESIYVIPFEQIEMNLSGVYSHENGEYYRASIIHIDAIPNTDIKRLRLYLIDYGIIIYNVNYHLNSTNLKFLHKNFSTLPTEVYDCRLANIHPPPTSIEWHDDARQFINSFMDGVYFSVQVVDYMNPFYCIYLWIEQKSMNELLVQHGFAVEFDDVKIATFEPPSSTLQTMPSVQSNMRNNYINEELLLRQRDNNIEFNVEENNLKHFIISIEHAYYFVKHPFTKRPCLPCFEVARLLNMDETHVSKLNLIRETKIELSEKHRTLFDDLRHLQESSKCPHINRNDAEATVKLYDLSAVRDHLCKIKFTEGDVIDALGQEYDNYDRPGYWNEVKNSYISEDNLESYQENLHERRELYNFRTEQLVSLSKAYNNSSSQNEIHNIEQELETTNHKILSVARIHSPTIGNHVTQSLLTTKVKSSNNKMRDTLYRIARPFDQQFSLNVRFNHQIITNETFNEINDDGDIEERFQDLHRITKHVIEFFILEYEVLDENSRDIFDKARDILSNLIETNISLENRIEIYNYCLQAIEYFQPIIRCSLQRTDSIDIIY
ncbi:unnamed protein product [Rotaria socialis]|uniref:HTH OST-type domain-containing protein n=1 Tax=Rotaria socialis TaxID=392032 RepID=A0A821GNA9_9BILA|nr:unnamed protein product [Rotaria socialis]CAF4671559.1 unnamed protein product [Rotaria socialis]